MSQAVICTRDGAVVLLTLNRPDARNAMSPDMILELDEACAEARDDDSVRVIVLSGGRGPAFCAGGDLKKTIPLFTGARPPESETDRRVLALVNERERPLPIRGDVRKPLIAAVEGIAYGGGLELVLACDIVIAGADAKFAAPEASVGAYPTRLPVLLAARTSYGLAVEMTATAAPINAARALQAGLVNQITAAGDAEAAAINLAKLISKNAPLAVSAVRAAARETIFAGMAAGLKADGRAAVRVYASNDAKEGPRAFAEKRRPSFTGT